MIDIQSKNLCCGCGACSQICPKRCISFVPDEEGFLYPNVNKISCINCGLCEKVCPVLNQEDEKYPIKIYACKNKDKNVRMNSSSGGLFTAIAEEIIKKNGVVFGVEFDRNWNVVFSHTDNIEGLKIFQGSKYVQAIVGNSYKEAEVFLKEGRLVLFSGTSCQIAGLHKYLRKQYENLVTVDFICHGVPSQKLFSDYLNEEILYTARRAVAGKSIVLQSLNVMSLIKGIRFRDKSYGWKKYRFVLTLAEPSGEGKKSFVLSSPLSDTSYGKCFLGNLSLRPSCYHCPAKSGKAGSDLTIADFWGVQNYYPDFDDDKGITLAIVNNSKAEKYIPFDKLEYIEPSFEQVFEGNNGYFKSTPLNEKRRIEFWNLHNNGYGLRKINRLMFPISMKTKIKRIIKRIFRIHG